MLSEPESQTPRHLYSVLRALFHWKDFNCSLPLFRKAFVEDCYTLPLHSLITRKRILISVWIVSQALPGLSTHSILEELLPDIVCGKTKEMTHIMSRLGYSKYFLACGDSHKSTRSRQWSCMWWSIVSELLELIAPSDTGQVRVVYKWLLTNINYGNISYRRALVRSPSLRASHIPDAKSSLPRSEERDNDTYLCKKDLGLSLTQHKNWWELGISFQSPVIFGREGRLWTIFPNHYFLDRLVCCNARN